jgi:hypothetical protein
MAAILNFTLHKVFTQKQHILECFAFFISKAQISVVSGVRAFGAESFVFQVAIQKIKD